MLVDKFKEIAETLGLVFNYGSEFWQNLSDYITDSDVQPTIIEGEEGEEPSEEIIIPVYLLLLYKDTVKQKNEYGATVATTFTGEFFLVMRSEFNQETYLSKYEARIKYLEAKANLVDEAFGYCDGWVIQNWKEVEVINQLDTNLDGLRISFTLRHE